MSIWSYHQLSKNYVIMRMISEALAIHVLFQSIVVLVRPYHIKSRVSIIRDKPPARYGSKLNKCLLYVLALFVRC